MQMRLLASAFFVLIKLFSGHFFAGHLLLKLGHEEGGEDANDAEDNEDPADWGLEEAHDVAVADA